MLISVNIDCQQNAGIYGANKCQHCTSPANYGTQCGVGHYDCNNIHCPRTTHHTKKQQFQQQNPHWILFFVKIQLWLQGNQRKRNTGKILQRFAKNHKVTQKAAVEYKLNSFSQFQTQLQKGIVFCLLGGEPCDRLPYARTYTHNFRKAIMINTLTLARENMECERESKEKY